MMSLPATVLILTKNYLWPLLTWTNFVQNHCYVCCNAYESTDVVAACLGLYWLTSDLCFFSTLATTTVTLVTIEISTLRREASKGQFPGVDQIHNWRSVLILSRRAGWAEPTTTLYLMVSVDRVVLEPTLEWRHSRISFIFPIHSIVRKSPFSKDSVLALCYRSFRKSGGDILVFRLS